MVVDYSQLIMGEILKGIACHSLVERCPKSIRCSAPLCPLDADINERVYLKGDPICRLPFETLVIILNGRFKKQYKKFMKVCLEKEARFRPLKVVQNKKKEYPKYEQLEMKSLLIQG